MEGGVRPPGRPSKPCFAFQRCGACKFGSRCAYSHEIPGGQGQRPPRTGSFSPANVPRQAGAGPVNIPRQASASPANIPRQAGNGKLREWKRLLEQSSLAARPPAQVVARFFQLGLELMDGDVGAAQEAIKLLAGEAGLSLIRVVSDRQIEEDPGATLGTGLWATELKPLFQLITHPRVVDSAVLEQEVAAIFNFLLGIGGSRVARLFGYACQLVESWPRSPTTGCSRIEAVELSLAVLSKMLDCNTTNIVNKSFSSLAARFTAVLGQASPDTDEFSRLQAFKYLDYIRRRVEVGDSIPALQDLPHAPVAREFFVLRRDLPGQISAEGPRHDNDHAAITSIKILPTFEEIISSRGEYLPTTDPSQWHIKGIRGRLDREFRLLREDTVGQLRDAVREALELIRNPRSGQSRYNQNGVRTYTYDSPTPMAIEFDRVGGMEMLVRCDQLSAVRNASLKKRRDFWAQCKRLQAGALVCSLDATGAVLFYVVSDSTMRDQNDRDARRTANQSKTPTDDSATAPECRTLADDESHLYVRLQPVDAGPQEAGQVLRWYKNVGYSPRRCLVEFPGILLPSFKYTLEALQQMYEKPNIPFSDILAPQGPSVAELSIRPAQYARKAGFTFDLDCLTLDKTPLAMSPLRPLNAKGLASRSALDPTQSAALLSTLSRELSLIQGPPGTGKSYTGEKIIQVLLANEEKAKLGPILCVCYTNHALDQLLEHLLDDGIKGIIRIGSRSKSERLQGLNLRLIAKGSDRTKAEKSTLWLVEETLRDAVRQANLSLAELSGSDTLRSLKSFLEANQPQQHRELFGEDEDGWQEVKHKPEDAIYRWLGGGSEIGTKDRPLDVLTHAPLSSMNHDERRWIHHHWLRSIRDPIITKILRLQGNYVEMTKQRDRVRGEVDLRCLQQAAVIGVTTTGLARNLDILRKLRCKVMVCEEAGEVLEAHLLTALLPSVEHAVLIGDHLQLRPQIQNYELQSSNPRGQQYSLDTSLFERLVQPPHDDFRLPFSALETQRRMHPSIAELVRSTLYPALKDDESVTRYPGVVGMKKRLFWFHHEHLEAAAASNDPLSTSHVNDFEIDMTVALVSHLVRQGEYLQGEIAVITPYLGQLHKLRRKMESMFEICVNDRDLEDLEAFEAHNAAAASAAPPPPRLPVSKTTLLKTVRVATVDNFQGEEARIVVISLVRSNPQNRCGFLSTPNRINVLLSRAQHGMYIIGNATTCKNVAMWANVMDVLLTNGSFGTQFELQCPRHPNTPLAVSQPDHFLQFAPESGCNLPCDKRLHCGHTCAGRCHADVLHNAVKCLEDCPRLKKGCNHSCPLRCGDFCHEKCQLALNGISLALPCGHHVSSARCWEAQDPASIRCEAAVTRTVPGCDHKVTVRCHEDVAAANYRCTAACGHLRGACGHTCKSECFRCNTRAEGAITVQNHGICQQVCSRKYSACRHSCAKTCHSESACPPCQQPCEVRCSHSRCGKACNEPCAPCAESTCASSCPHGKCTMPCAAPCDWVPCSLGCIKNLGCGHQCPSLCGEACPDARYCQQCGSDDIKSTCVDFLEMREYREIHLAHEPCIFPDCGHFLTVTSMDGQMGVATHYKLDSDGLPAAVRGASQAFASDDGSGGVPVCATCRGSLRNISRYGRIVRRAMLDEATKKFIAWSTTRCLSLAESLGRAHESLRPGAATPPANKKNRQTKLAPRNSRLRALLLLHKAEGSGRYDGILGLRVQISAFANQVRKEEQPFQRVADLVTHANRQRRTALDFQYDESVIQIKGQLLATVLLLKCDAAVLADFVQLRSKGARSLQNQTDECPDLSPHLRDCAALVELARRTTYPTEEVQGHILYTQLCAFSRALASLPATPIPAPIPAGGNTSESASSPDVALQEAGLEHVAQARALLLRFPSTAALKDELDAAESMLNDGVYRPVTTDELVAVYHAMSGELSGTGHWHLCQNGHPFTIGECGMPMEQARCPECGAPIGGQNHRAVEGVRHATEIEEVARGVGRLGL